MIQSNVILAESGPNCIEITVIKNSSLSAKKKKKLRLPFILAVRKERRTRLEFNVSVLFSRFCCKKCSLRFAWL